MIVVELQGTIKRMCSDCGLHKECVFFQYQGITGMLCDKCLIKKFGIGVITDRKNFKIKHEWCVHCEVLSMLNISTRITAKTIIKKFKCKHCGVQVNRRINKWSK